MGGGVENLNLTGRDIQNFLRTKRKNYLEKWDAQLMLKYFQKRQSNSPRFFYAIHMDVEDHLANCFLVDPRSRIAYKNLWDVVLFDPKKLTNKYTMPFVPFTVVNNYHQSILFECALLWDENFSMVTSHLARSYVWCFPSYNNYRSRCCSNKYSCKGVSK